jgi:glutathione S-transferase
VENIEYVAIVTGLALLQAFVFAIQVGSARVKYGINAPAITGAPEFERAFRVHQNTLEQLVILIPSLWMFALFWGQDIAAGLGLVFVIGRQIYRSAYVRDPAGRSMGFSIGAMATVILLLGGIVGAVMDLL